MRVDDRGVTLRPLRLPLSDLWEEVPLPDEYLPQPKPNNQPQPQGANQ